MENSGEKVSELNNVSEKPEHPVHSQVYSIVTGKDPSWQSIIYELIASEQLNPWNIDIAILCRRYFEKVKLLEENNFHISSKMLLVAAILLRIKSEVLVDKYLKEIDEVLFGKTESEKQQIVERIIIDENELPLLMPRSPMPRMKKVTIEELMAALDTAINTESRRINRELEKKQRDRLARVDIPKFKTINVKERIRQFYARILTTFKHPDYKNNLKLPYSHFTKNIKQEKLAYFLPLLYLSSRGKLWLEQEKHFDEIYVYLYAAFKKAYPDHDLELRELQGEIAEIKQDMQTENENLGIDEDIFDDKAENPIGDLMDH